MRNPHSYLTQKDEFTLVLFEISIFFRSAPPIFVRTWIESKFSDYTTFVKYRFFQTYPFMMYSAFSRMCESFVRDSSERRSNGTMSWCVKVFSSVGPER